MKKLAIIIIFVLAGYAGICAQTQCPDGSQCVKQSVIEKCADVAINWCWQGMPLQSSRPSVRYPRLNVKLHRL